MKKDPEISSGKNGFTLIELLVSVVILVIVLTIFSRIFVQSYKFTNKNEDKLSAIQIAREVSASFKEEKTNKDDWINEGILDHNGQIQVDHIEDANQILRLTGVIEPDYTIYLDLDEGPVKRLMTVTITVENEKNEHAKSYAYLKFKDDLSNE